MYLVKSNFVICIFFAGDIKCSLTIRVSPTISFLGKTLAHCVSGVNLTTKDKTSGLLTSPTTSYKDSSNYIYFIHGQLVRSVDCHCNLSVLVPSNLFPVFSLSPYYS